MGILLYCVVYTQGYIFAGKRAKVWKVNSFHTALQQLSGHKISKLQQERQKSHRSTRDQVQTKQDRCCKRGCIFWRSCLCKQAEPPSQKPTASNSSRCTSTPTPAVNLSCPHLCSSGRTEVEHLTAGKATYRLQVRDEALCNHSTSRYLAFQRTTMGYIRWQQEWHRQGS